MGKLLSSCCLAGVITMSLMPVFAVPADGVKITSNTHAIMVKRDDPSFIIRLPSKKKSDIRWFLIDDKVLSFASIKQRTVDLEDDDVYEEWAFRLNRSAFRYPHVAQIRFVYTSPETSVPHVWTEGDQKIFTVAVIS